MREGEVAEMATEGEEKGYGGVGTKARSLKRKNRFGLWQTHSPSLLHPAHAQRCSPIFKSSKQKTREQTIVIFVKKIKKKTKKTKQTSSEFNATSTGKYVSWKQIFED